MKARPSPRLTSSALCHVYLGFDCIPRHNLGCFHGCHNTNHTVAYTLEEQEYDVYYDSLQNVHVEKTWFTCVEATKEKCAAKGKNFCPTDRTCRDNSKNGCQQCGGLSDPPGDPGQTPGSFAGPMFGDDQMRLNKFGFWQRLIEKFRYSNIFFSA